MNDKRFYPLFLLTSLSLLLFLKCVCGINNGSVKCMNTEREALLKFKLGLVDDSGLLSSWDNQDCCSWWGVRCNNRTGRVIFLDLHGDSSYDGDSSYLFCKPRFQGEVSFSVLIGLQNLRYLDLSCNNFSGSQMGEAIGSFHRLKHLNLSTSRFGGAVPHQLGNLSNLRSLDLSENWFTGAIPHQLGNLSNLRSLDLGQNDGLTTNNLVWLSQLRLLRQLDLSFIDLMNITNWKQVMFNLPFLEELHLGSCELGGDATPSLPLLLNSSSNSLFILDLSDNQLTSSSTYSWLFNISNNLVRIYLSYNELEGPIPDAFGEMISLEDINMASNHLTGGIPKSFQNLSHLCFLQLSNNNLSESFPEFLQKLSKGAESSLQVLDLSTNQFYGPFTDIVRFVSLRVLWLAYNRLTGSLHVNIGQFSKLEYLDISSNLLEGIISEIYFSNLFNLKYLDISSNLLEGIISEVHFSNLSNLKYLYLSFNSLTFNVSPKWVPPFQLDRIKLQNTSAGPHFPQWIRTQTNLTWLDLSSNGISEIIPSWFWNSTFKLEYLNLSHNQISGSLPELSPKFDAFSIIDLSHNNFSGPILSIPHDLTALHLHTNTFMGPISFLCAINGMYLDSLQSLDLSENQFSGDLPDCWMNMTRLRVLDLANNHLSGQIPESLGYLRDVQSLNLRNNHFVGEIPSSIKNCGWLQFIDVGGNNLTGHIPSWIGMFLTKLAFLSLRLNNFNGNIPQNICHLSCIQVLDLSRNNLSGEIPKCFNNFSSLTKKSSPSSNIVYTVGVYEGYYYDILNLYNDNMWVQWKRYYSKYSKTLDQLKVIDLSKNKLVGEIPEEIASLGELISLNLSINNLTGNIFNHIDQMKMLESLDLSRNQLFGEIPIGLASLHFLNVLDLAYNNLSGRIPTSTQLQSFDPSSYIRNSGLCGLPLDKCPGDGNDPRHTDHGKDDNVEDEDGFMSREVYMVMGLGFLFGLWGVFIVMLKHSWRNAYFKFLENLCDWVYVSSMVYWLRLKRMLNGN